MYYELIVIDVERVAYLPLMPTCTISTQYNTTTASDYSIFHDHRDAFLILIDHNVNGPMSSTCYHRRQSSHGTKSLAPIHGTRLYPRRVTTIDCFTSTVQNGIYCTSPEGLLGSSSYMNDVYTMDTGAGCTSAFRH